MSGQLNMEEIYKLLENILEKAGFKPFKEFTAVDSLVFKNSPVGFYSLKKCEHIGTAIHHNTLKYAVELDCDFEIRLMGKSCDYSDEEDFGINCEAFYSGIVLEKKLFLSSMEMGKIYSNTTLTRLERDITVSLRVCLEEDT